MRQSLLIRYQTEKKKGIEKTTLWYDMKEYIMTIDNALLLLDELELYSSKCYDNTYRHIAQVRNIDIIENIKEYDYKIGYPNKLHFKI